MSRRVQMVRLIISAVILVVILVGWLLTRGSDPATAQVGDCIGSLPASNSDQPADASDAKKISCTDPSAAYKVLARKDNTSMDTFNNESAEQLCGDQPQTSKVLEITDSSDDSSSDGTLFCLGPIQH